MTVARPVKFVEVDNELKVQVRWKRPSQQGDTLEALENVAEYLSQMID